MPSPKLRVKRYRGDLTEAEHHLLRYGQPMADAFVIEDPDGSRRTDLEAARAAWEIHRAAILAEIPDGYTAWAARRWDGASGPISRYEHLGRPASPFDR